jgi:hypothetical protein
MVQIWAAQQPRLAQQGAQLCLPYTLLSRSCNQRGMYEALRNTASPNKQVTWVSASKQPVMSQRHPADLQPANRCSDMYVRRAVVGHTPCATVSELFVPRRHTSAKPAAHAPIRSLVGYLFRTK